MCIRDRNIDVKINEIDSHMSERIETLTKGLQSVNHSSVAKAVVSHSTVSKIVANNNHSLFHRSSLQFYNCSFQDLPPITILCKRFLE